MMSGASDTLLTAIDGSLRTHGQRGVAFPSARVRVSYEELRTRARRSAAALRRYGVMPGERIGLLMPSGRDFLDMFLAILQAGAVAVPLPPPVGVRCAGAYVERISHILRDAGARFLVVEAGLHRDIDLLVQQHQIAITVMPHGNLEIATSESETLLSASLPQLTRELALIQYTSGSTSDPKGVPLSHDNLLAGLRAVQSGAQLSSSDITALWLPLHHDMGLIGALSAVLSGSELALWSPLEFVRHPFRWLRAFAELKASVYAGPSFSYQSMLRYARDEDVAALDLSSWRIAFNGAEVIDVEVMQAFATRFAPAGFRAETMFPVYGLAEATLAVCFPPLGRPPVVRWVDAAALADERRVVPASPGTGRGVVSVGHAVLGHRVRVVDASSGDALGQDRVGEIEVCGPAVMRGYLNQSAPRIAGEQGWLRTGDLGFITDEGLFVTGRAKEMIIVRGHNFYPQDVERIVANVPGVYKGRNVGLCLGHAGRERMAVVFEREPACESSVGVLSARIRERVLDALGLDDLSVYAVEPNRLPRTTSGKYQRLRVRDALRGVSSDSAAVALVI